jgi:hypothetical protein
MRIAVVKAAHDNEAGVWYVEDSDVEGLHVEGGAFDDFCRNVAGAVADLMEGDGDPASGFDAAPSLTLDKGAESFGLIRQIRRFHRLRRLADLKLDIVVLKKIGGDRSFDREINVLRYIALAL